MMFYQPHHGVPPANRGQQQVHDSRAKEKVLRCARRWGKGRCALGELLVAYRDALQEPRPRTLIPAFHAWIVVPSYPQGQQVWNELVGLLPKGSNGIVASGGIREKEKHIFLRGSPQWNGGYGFLELKSANDPESLQTTGLDFLWISEAQDVDEEAFLKVRPTRVSPGRLGRAIYEGIPALYADHWFERIFQLALREGGRESKRLFAFSATFKDNPLLTPEQLEEIASDRDFLPEMAWRRMYMGEFANAAGYFKDPDRCIGGFLLEDPAPNVRYVGGLDLGRSGDFSVLLILDAEQRQVVYHQSWDPRYDWPTQMSHIEVIARQWNLQRLVVDATGVGAPFCEMLQQVGLPIEPLVISTSTVRGRLLQDLAISIESRSIQFPEVKPLLRQLRAFQLRRHGGLVRAEAPPGENDDEVFALALALTACEPPKALYNLSSGVTGFWYGPGGPGVPEHRRRILESLRERRRTAMGLAPREA